MKALKAAVDAAIRGEKIRACYLAQLDLPAGTDRFWSGAGTLNYNGFNWLGVGKLGTISGAGETAEIRTTETTYALSGILDSDGINKYLSNPIRNGFARCWIAFLTPQEIVIPDPILIDYTLLDTPGVTLAADGTRTLTLRGTSAVFNFNKPRGRTLTNEQLQDDFPGDSGFDRIPGLADRVVSWTQT